MSVCPIESRLTHCGRFQMSPKTRLSRSETAPPAANGVVKPLKPQVSIFWKIGFLICLAHKSLEILKHIVCSDIFYFSKDFKNKSPGTTLVMSKINHFA